MANDDHAEALAVTICRGCAQARREKSLAVKPNGVYAIRWKERYDQSHA